VIQSGALTPRACKTPVPQEEIRKLIEGFGRFRAKHFETDDSLYQRLTHEGQTPRIMVIACCDARDYHGTSAALEFAVLGLNVQHVIVLGHARCGGIRALLGGIDTSSGIGQFIKPWVEIANDARLQAPQSGSGQETARAVEQAAIQISLNNLMTFPWVRERVENGRLTLHGWYFDLDHGDLLQYQPDRKGYEPLR